MPHVLCQRSGSKKRSIDANARLKLLTSIFKMCCVPPVTVHCSNTRLDIGLPVEHSDVEFAILQLDEESSNDNEDFPRGHVVEWLDVSAKTDCQFNLLVSFFSKSPTSISSKLILTDIITRKK